ncbi:hypothetical protein [Novosphingobium sp. 11B]
MFQMTNIRWVIEQTGRLSERTDNLSSKIDGLSGKIDGFPAALEKFAEKLDNSAKERAGEFKADLKERHLELKSEFEKTRDKVIDLEKKVDFVKGAAWFGGGVFAILLLVVGVLLKFLLDKI